MSATPSLFLGAQRSLEQSGGETAMQLPAHHLVTHGVVVGMTGSGKTGLVTVLVEEALRSEVPVLVIDVKGDLPNLLLSFPSFDPAAFLPWVGTVAAPTDTRSPDQLAADLAYERARALGAWGIAESAVAAYARSTHVRVITPGSSAGEPLHVLSALERQSERWSQDPESARAALSAAVSLLLRLLGRDADPARSKEHVLLSVLAEARLSAGESADLSALLLDVVQPPITHVGALELDAFLPKSERRALAAGLNTLLASPTFASWRQGATLDVASWLTPRDGKTPAVVVSVAH
ncbi:MAG: putative ATP-binding protein, partial [Myxococcaceae bacterium]|nr:putative ATP-binding protein [Myxococcaceae bacterium]